MESEFDLFGEDAKVVCEYDAPVFEGRRFSALCSTLILTAIYQEYASLIFMKKVIITVCSGNLPSRTLWILH
jgi:hypothetical protein